MKQTALFNSKMARRLIRISIFLVAVPLIVTAALLGYFGREQIVWTAHTMEQIHAKAVAEARQEYQQVGEQALHRSSRQTQAVSMEALTSVSRKLATIQDAALSSTSQDFSALTRSSFADAMRQSLQTNRGTLANVHREMDSLFERTARDTRQRGAVRIEKAMLAQMDTLMQERAAHIARTVSEHLEAAKNYLTLAAQMPEMRSGNAAGQKTILDALVRRFPQMTLVTVLDKAGRETAMSAADHAVTDADLSKHPDAPYFRTALHGKEYLSSDNLPPTNDAPTLQVAVPIEAYRGKVVGVLAAHYSLSDLWDMIRNTRIGAQGFAYVLDGRSRPLLTPRPTQGALLTSGSPIEALDWRVVVALPRAEAMQPIQLLKSDIARSAQNAQQEMRRNIQTASEAASVALQSDALRLRQSTIRQVQDRSQQALARVKETTTRQAQDELVRLEQAIQAQTEKTQQQSDKQMAQAAGVTTSRLAARVRPLAHQAQQRADARLFGLALLIMVVSCAVGSLLAALTAARIVHPVAHLAQMAHAIAEGDLEKRVDEKAPDEIGDLAIAFNTMTASLQQSRSELQQAEGQLVQSAKLASLGTLSAGVAHELNQPVAIIRGIVQQLEDEPGLSDDIKADLLLIEGQTGRMVKIIRHLRTFSRAGGADYTEVEVNKVVQDCFLLVGEQLRTHNVQVAFALCEATPPVLGDANELEQVFLNLITNARDALEGRPDATITLRSRVEEDRYVLEVRDNGTGIPEEIVAHIFDPFFTTKEPGKGTGLGLSISHTIITKHKGSLRVHNEGGAVFTITLPLLSAQEQEHPKAA